MGRKAVLLTLVLALAAGAVGACKSVHGRLTQYDHGAYACAGTGDACEACSISI